MVNYKLNFCFCDGEWNFCCLNIGLYMATGVLQKETVYWQVRASCWDTDPNQKSPPINSSLAIKLKKQNHLKLKNLKRLHTIIFATFLHFFHE